MSIYLNSLHTVYSRHNLDGANKTGERKDYTGFVQSGQNLKEIAEIVRVSPRDIKPVLERAEKEREKELGINIQADNKGTENHQTQKAHAFSQAYRLFSEGKTPLGVAIELNLKERETTKYYRQYWKLIQLHSLEEIYEEIGEDIIHIPKIHRRIRAAGMRVDRAINLIKNANNDLPTLEEKYQKLKREVSSLELKKLEAEKTLNDLLDQIDRSEKMLKWLETSFQEEEANLDELEQKKIRLKRLIKQFKENNEEYLMIESTVHNRVTNLLSDGKGIMKVALNSLMQSMRADPQKYTDLINYNGSSSAVNTAWKYTRYNNGQQPYASFDNFYEEYKTTLLKDAEKIYNKLVREWSEQNITEYSIKNGSSQLFMPEKGRQQQLFQKPSNNLSLPLAGSNNQNYPLKIMKRIFVRAEF
jgi:ribosome assembly protein YihI (activator of Der GTPase)